MIKVLGIASIGLISACAKIYSDRAQGAKNDSKTKEVSINQPKFRDTMDENLSPTLAAEADELIKNLVVTISSQAVDCKSGVSPKDMNFGEKKLSEAVVDSSYKFLKGCDYIVKLVYVDSRNQKVILASDGKTINLSKSELEKDKPVAKVALSVSTEGKKFWSKASTIETLEDSDTEIRPEINNGGGQTQPAQISRP